MSKALVWLLVGYFVMSVLWVVTLEQKRQLQDENKALKTVVVVLQKAKETAWNDWRSCNNELFRLQFKEIKK